jgi:Lon protease-like protein
VTFQAHRIAGYRERVTEALPMFPLSTVLFPGIQLPLFVFEDRYRALVRHLLDKPKPADRLFGVVAIRQGYEVGDRGAHSVQVVGTAGELTRVEAHDDGTFDIEAVGRRRFRLHGLDSSGPYLRGEIAWLAEAGSAGPTEIASDAVAETALQMFDRYFTAICELRGQPMLPDHSIRSLEVTRDTVRLSYELAAAALLTLRDRQELLEADGAEERLRILIWLLRDEMRAMRAIPSLPATEVSRTGWSPN